MPIDLSKVGELRKSSNEYFLNGEVNDSLYIIYSDIETYRAHGDLIIVAWGEGEILIASRKHKSALKLKANRVPDELCENASPLQEYYIGKNERVYALPRLVNKDACVLFTACVSIDFTKFCIDESAGFDIRYTRLKMESSRKEEIYNWVRVNSLKLLLGLSVFELLLALTQVVRVLIEALAG